MRDYHREQQLLGELARCADLANNATVGELMDAQSALTTYCLARGLIHDWHQGEPYICDWTQTEAYDDALMHQCKDLIEQTMRAMEGKK